MARSFRLLIALEAASDELGQVLALLRAEAVDDPGAVSLGAGDRWLLQLYADVAGRPLELSAACGACETINSVVLDPDLLPAAAPRVADLGGGGLREPTYADLVELPDDPENAEHTLLSRCIVGSPTRAPNVHDLELVDDSLSGPLLLDCVECNEILEVPIDVQQRVLEALVRRLADVDVEVHLLASAYHWPLDVIEALQDDRRARLVELVSEGR